MIINSPYEKTRTRKDVLAHTGYDYRGKIFENSMSGFIIRKRGLFKAFLSKVEEVFTESVEQIKYIRVFGNMAADKHERRIP